MDHFQKLHPPDGSLPEASICWTPQWKFGLIRERSTQMLHSFDVHTQMQLFSLSGSTDGRKADVSCSLTKIKTYLLCSLYTHYCCRYIYFDGTLCDGVALWIHIWGLYVKCVLYRFEWINLFYLNCVNVFCKGLYSIYSGMGVPLSAPFKNHGCSDCSEQWNPSWTHELMKASKVGPNLDTLGVWGYFVPCVGFACQFDLRRHWPDFPDSLRSSYAKSFLRTY